jgi:DNA-binding transcriptional ArsR family regulator
VDDKVLAGLDIEQMRANAAEAAELLKTLANRNRLLILCTLAEGEASVSELNARVELSQPALSQHLGVLRQSGIVRSRREAQTIYYSLSESSALALIQTLHDIYCV